MRKIFALSIACALMGGVAWAQPTDNSWEVMDGLLLCPADAGAGDTVTAYIVFDGVVQTRADFVAAGHTVAWLGIMDHWVGPEDIGVAMNESGGIALDLPGDFSPTTGIACGTGIEDGWPAGTEMAAAAYTGDVAATLSTVSLAILVDPAVQASAERPAIQPAWTLALMVIMSP